MTRCMRAEWLRLRSDYILLGCLAFVTLTSVASVIQSSGSGGVHDRLATAGIETAGIETAGVQTAVMAALYGAIRFALEHRDGVVARAVLLGRRRDVLRAKVVISAAGGAVIGLYGMTLTLLTAGSTMDLVVLRAVLGGVAASAFAAPWGMLIGSLVRHYVLAPLAALVSLLIAIPVLTSMPSVGRLLPLGAQLSLAHAGTPPLLSVPLALAALVVWLLAATAIAERVLVARDVL